MMRACLIVFSAALMVFAPAIVRAERTNTPPDFKEVYQLLQSNLRGVSDAELQQAAVEGLLSRFPGKVSLDDADGALTNRAPTSRVETFDDGVAYVRVRRVEKGLANAVNHAWADLSSTNKLKGLALDLRFAGGNDYQAAGATVDLFTSKERTLLEWEGGNARSSDKTNAISLPVVVLVNQQTSAAAEALAAAMRETGVALIIGSTTAGNAMVAKEFPLSNGQTLRVASSPVRLADGSALNSSGVKPDIEVEVEDEWTYFENPYADSGRTNSSSRQVAADQVTDTNRPPRRTRFNEADLVREHRRGNDDLQQLPPLATPSPEMTQPVIKDPVLSRAVDLLKGLAVVRGTRS